MQYKIEYIINYKSPAPTVVLPIPLKKLNKKF